MITIVLGVFAGLVYLPIREGAIMLDLANLLLLCM